MFVLVTIMLLSNGYTQLGNIFSNDEFLIIFDNVLATSLFITITFRISHVVVVVFDVEQGS